jgi:hypothetical protein
MTVEMWKVQLGRMHELFARRGIPWLDAEEERALSEWLGRHAGEA